jgi:isopentenyldiphosphate isomerase
MIGDAMAEQIDIYDENNKPMGFARLKRDALVEGLWHRASHVWIYDSRGEILLQLRSDNVPTFPGLWDVAVGGHVGAGEEPIAAALRETYEELGLGAQASDLEFVTIIKTSEQYKELTENEFKYVYFMRFDGTTSDLKLQIGEVQKVGFFPLEEIEKGLAERPERYVPHGSYWTDMISEARRRLNR